MAMVWSTLAALVLMTAAGYAQHRIPYHTAGRAKIAFARVTLAVVGIAFGYVTAVTHAQDPATAALAFLAGFGAVHAPAAIILFLKRQRASGKS